MATLEQILEALDEASIHHRLERIRPGYVAVIVAVPGQRWEIEVASSGEVEVEVFTSDGRILDATALPELIARFSD